MLGTRVRNRSGFALRVGVHGRAALVHRQPNDVHLQVGIGESFQYTMLDFGGPPKANPSSRVNQQQKAYLVDIAIEGGTEQRIFFRCVCCGA